MSMAKVCSKYYQLFMVSRDFKKSECINSNCVQVREYGYVCGITHLLGGLRFSCECWVNRPAFRGPFQNELMSPTKFNSF